VRYGGISAREGDSLSAMTEYTLELQNSQGKGHDGKLDEM